MCVGLDLPLGSAALAGEELQHEHATPVVEAARRAPRQGILRIVRPAER